MYKHGAGGHDGDEERVRKWGKGKVFDLANDNRNFCPFTEESFRRVPDCLSFDFTPRSFPFSFPSFRVQEFSTTTTLDSRSTRRSSFFFSFCFYLFSLHYPPYFFAQHDKPVTGRRFEFLSRPLRTPERSAGM